MNAVKFAAQAGYHPKHALSIDDRMADIQSQRTDLADEFGAFVAFGNPGFTSAVMLRAIGAYQYLVLESRLHVARKLAVAGVATAIAFGGFDARIAFSGQHVQHIVLQGDPFPVTENAGNGDPPLRFSGFGIQHQRVITLNHVERVTCGNECGSVDQITLG